MTRTPSAPAGRAPPPMASFFLASDKLALEPLALVKQCLERARQIDNRHLKLCGGSFASSPQCVERLARGLAGQRLDAAHAGGQRRFRRAS